MASTHRAGSAPAHVRSWITGGATGSDPFCFLCHRPVSGSDGIKTQRFTPSVFQYAAVERAHDVRGARPCLGAHDSLARFLADDHIHIDLCSAKAKPAHPGTPAPRDAPSSDFLGEQDIVGEAHELGAWITC